MLIKHKYSIKTIFRRAYFIFKPVENLYGNSIGNCSRE